MRDRKNCSKGAKCVNPNQGNLTAEDYHRNGSNLFCYCKMCHRETTRKSDLRKPKEDKRLPPNLSPKVSDWLCGRIG